MPPEKSTEQLINVSDLDLKCASCGEKVNELPYQPDPKQKVHCMSCYAKMQKESKK